MTRRLAPVPDTPKRAGLYIRVSAVMGRSDETFRSPELQLDAIRRALPGLGAVEHRQYVDIDRTGQDFKRDGIVQAIDDAHNGEIDLLVTFDLARFGRNVSESLEQIKGLRKAGVPLASTVEKFDDSPEGQFMLTQFLALAELYAKQIGRRWQQLQAYRLEQGLYSGSVPPLGYTREVVDGALTKAGRLKMRGPLLVDPVLAPAVTAMFHQFAAGAAMAEVCRRFSVARGVPTSKTTVRGMLDNPVYIGQLRVGGRRGARNRAVPEAIHPGTHPRLVDERTWRAVQRRRARDRRTPSRTLAVTHSLVGLAKCDGCKYMLMANFDRTQNKHRLKCRDDVDHGCAGVGRPQVGQVEQVVLDQCRAYLAELQLDPAAVARADARRAEAKADLVSLRHEVARLEGALGRLTAKHFAEGLSDVAYKAGAAELERSLTVMYERLDAVESAGLAVDRRRPKALLEAMLELWPDATPSERNLMLRQVVSQVTVRRAHRRGEEMAARVHVAFL